jgi:hypothetical protein
VPDGPAPAAVSREQVLAYRVEAQQLTRVQRPPAELAVLDLGVAETPYGSSRPALAARTSVDLRLDGAVADEGLALVWSVRGAPHLHRRSALVDLAAATWPLSDADAGRRIATSRIPDGAALGLSAFRATAEAFATVVRAPMEKGEVSRAVSELVPAALCYDCPACAARHISGALFQQAGLAGGVRLVPTGRGTRLEPIPGWPGPPVRAAGTAALVSAYLRLLGPAAPADVAAFLGVTRRELAPVWPEGMAEVRVAGRAGWLPADRLDALRAARPSPLVRLLAPGDPWLQARDRDLLVPERSRHAAIWRMIGNPGALLVQGEIVGTWRIRQLRPGRLAMTVTGFTPLPARVTREVRAEADRVAAARGASTIEVRLDP